MEMIGKCQMHGEMESRFKPFQSDLVLSVFACILGFTVGCQPPESSPFQQPPTVSGVHALTEVEAFIKLGPRPSGSDNSYIAAEWLKAKCRHYGYLADVDEWQEDSPAGPTTYRNVTAVLPGATRSRVLVASHYDTKRLSGCPGFIGANDSGSSTGLLLELMRVLKSVTPWPGNTVEFVFFDGEECVENYTSSDGLRGSRRLAGKIHKSQSVKQYRAMILLDMIGDRDLSVTLPQDTDDHLARQVFQIAERQGTGNKFSYFSGGSLLDDHTPFQELGIPCIDLIDFEYGPGNSWWHTEADTLDKLAAESLTTVGNVCLELVMALSREEVHSIKWGN